MSRLMIGPREASAENAIVQRFSRLARLSAAELEIVRDLSEGARHYATQTELAIEGRVQPPLMLLTGWACYQRVLGDGRRQIVRFLLPGDVIGSLSRPAMPAASTTLALTSVVVADARALMRTQDASGALLSGLVEAVAALSHADDVNLRDQVVRLGRQTAYERLVHLLLEFHHRLGVIGQVDGDTFSLPLTQEILADALGLSVVHINRTLQQVRRDRLLDLRGGQVTLRQIELMQATADWVSPG